MKNYLILLLFIAQTSIAQEILTLENAISIALEKNYDVKIAQLQQTVAETQVFKGNAGMLPNINFNANAGTAFNEVKQVLANGSETNRFGVNLTPSANITFAWTLYDGKRMYAIYDRLKSQSELSQIQTRIAMENTMANVMAAYYEIMRQKQTVVFLETIIKYYQERLNITDQRWQFGKGSKLDYLQSKTDLGTQTSLLVQARTDLKNAKVALNNLLAREPNMDYDVQEVVTVSFDPSQEELRNRARTANKTLQAFRKATDITLIQQREAQGLKQPRVTLNANLGYQLSKTNAGLFLYNQNYGLSPGVGLTVPIFNGQIIRRQIQTSKINTEIAKTQELDWINQMENDLVRAYNQYQTDKEILKLEEEYNKVAEENMQISLEKFRLGGSTILEINEAQRSLNTSLNRLTNARYNIKISELQLLRLSGELVK